MLIQPNVALASTAPLAAASRSRTRTETAEAAPADGAQVNAPPVLENPDDAVKKLAVGFGYTEFPQVSPDGEKLVFNTVGDFTTSQMLIMDTKGGKVRSLFTGEEVTADNVKAFLARHKDHIDEQATWSLDGKSLFFRTNRQGTFALARYDFKSEEQTVLAHDPKLNMKHPAETEDGWLVAYGGPPSEKYATVDQYTNLFMVNPENGRVRMLTESDGSVSYKHPIPYGDKILAHKEMGKEGSEQADLVMIDPKTGVETNLTNTPSAIERHPMYCEKRDLIAFHSDETGDKNIWIGDPDGGRKCQLTFYGRAAQSPCWSPGGKKIFFVKKDIRQAEDEPFYARQAEIRVLDVKDALKDLAKQARAQVKDLEKADAPAEQVAAARQRYEDYKYFLERY
ncbi:MAG: hypothetical protein AMXMBFR33_49100 [Candidatus Xenobia bacterium]